MKIKFLIVFCVLMTQLFAQRNDEVVFTGTGSRQVEPAYRMTENPTIIDTTISTKVVEYPLLSTRFDAAIQLETIQPAAVKVDSKLTQLYPFYVKLGIGSELMPLGEIYFDSKRSRKTMYGAHLKHLSSFGNFENYAPAQFDRTKLGVYGAFLEKKYTLSGNAHYNNQGLHYYGIRIPTDSISAASIQQRYQDVGFLGTYASHVKDSAHFNYQVGLEYNNYQSQKPQIDSLEKWRANEHFFALRTSGAYKMGKELFTLDLNVLYNAYRYGTKEQSNINPLDTALVFNNTVVNLAPSIFTYLNNNRFKVQVGANVLFDVWKDTKVRIYPLVEARYALFNDMFVPYIGLRGGLKQNTFKVLSQENEFVLSNLPLRNENTLIDFYGGFKGTISKNMSFHIGGSFARIQDKAFFITDTTYSLRNKFGVVYDTLSLAQIEGSLCYQMAEKLKIDVIGRYFSYLMSNQTYAWQLPQYQFILRGAYNLYDKFYLNLDLNIEGGRRALVYELTDDALLENNQFITDLGFIADVNLGLEYRYNKRISAFVQFNNFAAQRYNRWYNYPVQAFQVLGGLTFRF